MNWGVVSVQVQVPQVPPLHTGIRYTVSNAVKGGTPVKNMIAKLFDMETKYSPGQHIEGFRIVKTIGEGRYGICYLITDDKNLYTFKQLKKRMYHKGSLKLHYEEEILKALKHEAIPGFIKKIEDDKLIGYVLEYKQGVTLEAMIFRQEHVFTRYEIYCIGKQLVSILDYLHGKGVVHRDIRIPNTLCKNNRIYLVDFGLARWIDNDKYKPDKDFTCLGDLLIHLYYTSFKEKPKKSRPWYEELALSNKELSFLKRLMRIDKGYESIKQVEAGFEEIFFD